jgi:hypothetical protein
MQDSVKRLYWNQALIITQVYEFIQKVKASEKNVKMDAPNFGLRSAAVVEDRMSVRQFQAL